MRTNALRAAVVALCSAGVLAACSSTSGPATPTPAPSSSGPASISLAVYGPPAVTAAYSRLAAAFTASQPETSVTVRTYSSRDQALAAVERQTVAGNPPDLFLADRNDLATLVTEKLVQPVDELLSERRVEFGDGYSRAGLEAFSSDAALQCMPTDVSPLLVYYNTRLIDLSLAAEPGKRPVTQDTGWTLDEFVRVARLARRPGVRGVYIAPALEQVAPFLGSGGGDLVDDPDKPTRLALSEDATASALEQLLLVVRDPALTFDRAALRRVSPVERFKAGRLGMMLGYRELVPQLRQKQGLNFDVMPLPRLGSAETNARMRGLCISSKTKYQERAADLLTYLLTDSSMKTLAATGYVMPTNLNALDSEAFLQPSQRPLHGTLYQREMRHVQPLPSSPGWEAVRRVAAAPLQQLFAEPVTQPGQLAAIDEASRLAFNPDAAPSPSPSPDASPTG